MNRIRTVLQKDALATERLRLRHFSGPGYLFAAVLAHSGDSWFWILGLLILWVLADAHWRSIAVLMALGICLLAVLVISIKLLVRRRRPEGNWGTIYRNTDPHSFPSGHAARVAMLAVVAIGVGPAWMAILLSIWAPMVSLSRVIMGVHYLSDILAGLVLGVIIGLGMLAVYPFLANFIPFLI